MGLVFYIIGAVVGAAALASYLIFAIVQRERSLAAYANLITAISLLIIADGLILYINTVPVSNQNIPVWFNSLKVGLTIVSNVWTAIVLPLCASAFSRTPLTFLERLLVAFSGIILGAFAFMASVLGNNLVYNIDPFLFVAIIAYTLIRLFIFRKSIPKKFVHFIYGSLALHPISIASILIYFYLISPASLPVINIGFTIYFIIWNAYNLFALFTFFSIASKITSVTDETLAETNLTEREKQIIELLCEGMSTPHIADTLSLAIPTVKNHLSNIYTKTGLRTRAKIIATFGNKSHSSIPLINREQHSAKGLLVKNSSFASVTSNSSSYTIPPSRQGLPDREDVKYE